MLALESAPQVTVEFCLTYLPRELSSWRDLLSLLLEPLLRSPQSPTHRALYKGELVPQITKTLFSQSSFGWL